MANGLTEDELKALVGTEMRQSLGYASSKLSNARLKAEYFYLAQPIGELSPPEIEGRSSVVSTDVRDTIESMLPQLMVTFCGSDSVVSFEATKPQDEQNANIVTEYINYLFFKKNNGHKIAYTWMKDALLQKNGIVKCWWDSRFEETKEEYRGLSDIELAQLLDDPEIEVISQDTYPDETDAKQRLQAIEQLTQQLQQASQPNPQAQQAAQQGNPQAQQALQGQQQQTQAIQAHIQSIQAQPPKMQFDVVCKRTKKGGKIAIENVPPEEFLIARSAKDIQTARFVGHRVQRTVSELKSMGYKNVDNLSGEDQGQAVNMERIERLSWNDENAYLSDETSIDDSQRKIWVLEAYLRADFDGDGIAELRKVTVAGNELLDNEEVDYIPFVSITPVPLPHTFFGLSVADLAFESQKTKTSILRAALDNLYLQVNGRYFAVENQVNLDDLLTSRPGGVVRVKQPNAVGRLDQSQSDVSYTMSMLEYQQQDLENKTGWTRYSQGNDSGSLNDTATGVNIITNRADMRLDLIARNFGEGYSELFKLMLKLVCQYQDEAAEVKLSGGWITIDPREWRNQFDVTIEVGIGMGNKDQKVQHMLALIAQQQQSFQIGVTNPMNVYNSHAELTRLLGYKNVDKFFTDPSKNPPPQKPDPEQVKAQAQMQIETQKMQLQDQQHQREMQLQAQLEQVKQAAQAQQVEHQNELEARRDQLKAQLDAQVELARQQAEDQRRAKELEFEAWKAKLEADTKIMIAQITAASVATPAQEFAASQTVSTNGNY